MKHEWRKHEKNIYLPKEKPMEIDIPEMTFLVISGQGNPNDQAFKDKVATLYSLAYGVRMSYKWQSPPSDYYEYTVYPLEGVWDLIDPSKDMVSKDNLKYDIMIRQPSFLTQALFEQVLQVVMEKKANPLLREVSLKTMTEGKCVQMLHKGSYDDEHESFAIMEEFAREMGKKRKYKTHREIYLSDPQKVAPEKLKTLLRFIVE